MLNRFDKQYLELYDEILKLKNRYNQLLVALVIVNAISITLVLTLILR